MWDVDVKTWEPGFATGQSLHPVECRVCQTLMYATEGQIGRELKCPDCGALTMAKRRAPKAPSGVAPVMRGEEYELDAASAPEPRPAPVPISIRDAELHEHTRATTVGPDGRLIVQKQETVKRPVRPAVPLVQGVWRMLFTQEIIARWGMMSILSGMGGWAIFDALATPGNAGLASFSAIMVMIFGMVMVLLWLTFAAPTFLAVVSESAEGHDKLYDPPGWSPFEWLGEGVFLIVAVAAAGMPGMLMWSLRAPLAPEILVLTGVCVAGVIFPLALLGALLENSALGVISPRLLSTLVRRPGLWLLFYLENALLGAAVAGLGWALLQAGPAGAVGLPLVAMAAALLHMRLLGRLAWWISDVMLEDEPEQERDAAAAAHPHLAAARAAEAAAREARAAAQVK